VEWGNSKLRAVNLELEINIAASTMCLFTNRKLRQKQSFVDNKSWREP
jgi:hypothetical protein